MRCRETRGDPWKLDLANFLDVLGFREDVADEARWDVCEGCSKLSQGVCWPQGR